MAMTEKQGGSDVRANTTRAIAMAATRGRAFELVGHKFFVSAPMCDAFLTLAQAPGGLTCFLAPRWRPDGTKNPIQIVRLKRKMGNVSNASSETEWRGALAWRVGPEGRGVATILEMVAATRFDCMIGSSAGMRMAAAQALDHCRQRKAFGALLIDQPAMRAVLADLALEAEASLALTLRVARALDNRAVDPSEDVFARIAAPLGKYWICKRTPAHAYEAMECLGGSGAMENSPMPRLYREAPINAIWEGSGNVQCLDVLRAISRAPQTLDAYFAELDSARGENRALDALVEALKDDMRDLGDFESRAREVCDRLALALQASVMRGAGRPPAPTPSAPPASRAAARATGAQCRRASTWAAIVKRARRGEARAIGRLPILVELTMQFPTALWCPSCSRMRPTACRHRSICLPVRVSSPSRLGSTAARSLPCAASTSPPASLLNIASRRCAGAPRPPRA